MKLTELNKTPKDSASQRPAGELVAKCFDRLMRGDFKCVDYSKCNSPIEDILFQEFQKLKADSVIIHRQYHCLTQAGRFYLDFLFTIGTRKIGVECDGKDFHDPVKDEARDHAILGEGYADIIYRMRGTDLHHRIHDVLDLLHKRETVLFSKRGLTNLQPLAAHANERHDDLAVDRAGYCYGVIRHVATQDEAGDTVDEKEIFLSWRESYLEQWRSFSHKHP